MNEQQRAALDALDAAVAALTTCAKAVRNAFAERVPVAADFNVTWAVETARTETIESEFQLSYSIDAAPTVGVAPVLTEQVIPDRSRVLCVPQWYDGGAIYLRQQGLIEWSGATGSLRLRRKNVTSGGVDYTPARTYGLLIDGQRVADVPFATGQSDRVVSFPLTGLRPGWLRIDVDGCQDGESFVTWFGFHRVPGMAEPDLMPVMQGSHPFSLDKRGIHRWAWRPTRYTPRPAPLAPQSFTPVGAGTIRGRLVVATDAGMDVTTPNVTTTGTINTHGRQAYFFSDILAGGVPTIPHVDGPRGVGTAGFVMDIHVATPTAPGERERAVEAYFMTAYSWRKLMRDGSIVTLAGWVHDGMASYYGDGAKGRTLRLVGDWSAVPATRRGYKEPWGSAWLQVEIDEAAAPIPSEGGLKPHRLPPIGLVCDTGNNRVLAHQFDPARHGPEPIVTEWLTGLSMPFGIVTWGDDVIISERSAHRIIAVDPKTKAVRRVILQRDPAMPGNATPHPWAGSMQPDSSTLAERRAQPCLGPEMLRVWGDWLYVSSYAAQCIKRVHLVTGAVEYVCDVAIDRQSWFVNFDIDRNGAFAGVPGAVAYCTFGQQQSAMHYVVLLNGTKFNRHLGQAPWDAPQAYPMAVAFSGDGRLYVAGSAMGITRFESGAPIDTARYQRGKAAFDAAGGWVRYGPGGFDPYGYTPPFGLSDDADYYLTRHDIRK